MMARHQFMAAGLVVAAWLAFFGDKSPSPNIVEPVTRDATTSKSAIVVERTSQNDPATSNKVMRVPYILALQDRDTLIGGAHNKSSRTSLFGRQDWTPPPPLPPKLTPSPPLPPMAPPLPFTYIGKKFDGTSWEVYLMQGEQIFIVHESTILENTYHIDSIKPPILTLTYLPQQQVQSLTIGGTD